MPAHFDKYNSTHKAEELFNIVADVEKYPEFLPWVGACRIVERGEDFFIADMMVKFKSFSHKYTSRVDMVRGNLTGNPWKINVGLVRGPFKYLRTNWVFRDIEAGKSEIEFELDFKFESMIFEKMLGFLFEKAVLKMTDAFEKRADELLGKN